MASVGPLVLAHYVVLQRPHHASPQPQPQLHPTPPSTPPSTATRWSRARPPTRVLMVHRLTSPPTTCCSRPRGRRIAHPSPRQASSVPPTHAPPCPYPRLSPRPRTTRLLPSTAHSCILCRPTEFASMLTPRPLARRDRNAPGRPSGHTSRGKCEIPWVADMICAGHTSPTSIGISRQAVRLSITTRSSRR